MFFKIVPILTKNKLREIYEDTQKLEQGVLGTPKIWDRVSPGNLTRVSNLWPAPQFKKSAGPSIEGQFGS